MHSAVKMKMINSNGSGASEELQRPITITCRVKKIDMRHHISKPRVSSKYYFLISYSERPSVEGCSK
jgi:hypothetical protein